MIELFLELVRDQDPGAAALWALFAAAFLEYLVPPWPGDAVVLAGSALVVVGAFSFPVILGVVVLGGTFGATAHYVLGRLLPVHRPTPGWLRWLGGPTSISQFLVRFRRYGYWLILANRFLPGVRAVTFVAAGAAQLRVGPTLALGLISNAVWSGLLLWLGITVGGHVERIDEWIRGYGTAVGGVLLLAIAGFGVVRWVQNRRPSRR